MVATLIVWEQGREARVELRGSRLSVGRARDNDVRLSDPSVSGLHAVLEHYPGGWTLRDLASTNGTWIEGRRIWIEHRLRHGEVVRFGSVDARFESDTSTTTTEPEEPPPPLTDREREVLVELCRPLASAGPFTPPATVAAIAERLFISPGAVKQHLARLQRKFDLPPSTDKRLALANAALRRGAVGPEDLRAGD